MIVVPSYAVGLLYYCIFLVVSNGQQLRQEWEASNYPNPTSIDYRRCGIRSRGQLCDPDSILTDNQRYRLNYELQQLEIKTRQEHAPDFCQKKGITGSIAIAKRVRGGSENAVKTMANEILHRWSLDGQCNKAIAIVVSIDDHKFWVARTTRVPIYSSEFSEIFQTEKPVFRSGDYNQALLNIIQATWKKSLSKHTPSGTDSGQPFRPIPDDSDDGNSDKRRRTHSGTKLTIPAKFWVLLAIFLLVVLPLICCCCCIYFCCCRKKNGGRESEGNEQPGGNESGGGTHSDGGGVRGVGGLLSGIGGSAIVSSFGGIIRNAFSGRRNLNRPPTVPPMDSEHGKGYGPVPTSDPSNRGLYPSLAVKDEGGGGSWN